MERAQTETQNGTCRSTWLLIQNQSTGIEMKECLAYSLGATVTALKLLGRCANAT
jgi:hypothetical protein